MFDKPVEEAVEWSFHKAFATFGGPDTVRHEPETGREQKLNREAKQAAQKEKEL